MIRAFRFAGVAAVLGASTLLDAAPLVYPDPTRVVGDWAWVYREGLPIMQPGDGIEYRIRCRADGVLVGTAWNGERELSHLRIVRVRVAGETVRFVHPAANHYYEGRLADDGRRIVGVERHHSQTDSMDLLRVSAEGDDRGAATGCGVSDR